MFKSCKITLPLERLQIKAAFGIFFSMLVVAPKCYQSMPLANRINCCFICLFQTNFVSSF